MSRWHRAIYLPPPQPLFFFLLPPLLLLSSPHEVFLRLLLLFSSQDEVFLRLLLLLLGCRWLLGILNFAPHQGSTRLECPRVAPMSLPLLVTTPKGLAEILGLKI